jgi:thioredoxin reductase
MHDDVKSDFYENKTVAIIGAGNAGFETFKVISS